MLWRLLTVLYVAMSAMKIYIQWVLMLSFINGCVPDCGTANATHVAEACAPDCWTEEYTVSRVPPAKALYDPIWMLLFVFYRYWHPLHDTNVVITLANDTRHNIQGDANICCFHLVKKVHGDDGHDMDDEEIKNFLPATAVIA